MSDFRPSEFLKQIWTLDGYYVIGVKIGQTWRWITAKPEDADEIVEKYRNADIYYGVNPRAENPNGKKGSDLDIEQANVLFADFDFKEKKECSPGIYKDEPNGELELCYEEDGKTFYVHRPPLSSLFEKVVERVPPPSFVVDSGNGYHFIWLLDRAYEIEDWKKLERWLVEEKLKDLGADPQVKDPSRVLRLPGSINQRSKRACRVIYANPERTRFIKPEHEQVVDAVLQCFRNAEDRRFELVGHLSGYLARKGVPLEDAEAIVNELYRRAGLPPEHVKDVKYTYRDFERGVNVTGFPHLAKLCEEVGAPLNARLLGETSQQSGGEATEEHVDTEKEEEVEIESFDTLRAYHDYKHGKPFVTVYRLVKVKTYNRKTKQVEYEPVLKWNVFTAEDGKIVEADEKSLNNEFIIISHFAYDPLTFAKVVSDVKNLPKELKDAKISEVYKKVLDFVKARINMGSEEDYVLTAVWIIASYFYPVFDYFPYFAPQKMGFNSGGSQLLNVLRKLLPRATMVHNMSSATLFRYTDKYGVSFLIDELRKEAGEELIETIYQMLLGCYQKGSTVKRANHTGDIDSFECFSPKAIVDQSLVTSAYDIASRSVFVRLIPAPNRVADYEEVNTQGLVDELYSVFLLYAKRVDELYHNNDIDSGYRGRYDQTYRPLVVIARLIDMEDETLRVEEQLHVALHRSMEYVEALKIEGDPQKRIAFEVMEYVKESLRPVIEGLSPDPPKPWARYNGLPDTFYITLADLRRKIRERLMVVHQRDISFRPNPEGEKEQVAERIWERTDPELTNYLESRYFVALLKKFYPDMVMEHRTKNVFVVNLQCLREILNFDQPPFSAGCRNPQNNKTRISYLSQSNDQNTKSLELQNSESNFGTSFRQTNNNDESSINTTELNVQTNNFIGTEEESSRILSSEVTEKTIVLPSAGKNSIRQGFGTQPAETNSKSFESAETTAGEKFYRHPPTETIPGRGSSYSPEGRPTENLGDGQKKESITDEKETARQTYGTQVNSVTRKVSLTLTEMKEVELLQKLSMKPESKMSLKKLTQDELKLLPDMKEKGYVNYDSRWVWLTLEGYIYLKNHEDMLLGSGNTVLQKEIPKTDSPQTETGQMETASELDKEEQKKVEEPESEQMREKRPKGKKQGKKEAKRTNNDGLPPTEIEVHRPKPDLEELYSAMPSVKKLVEEGKFTEDDAEKTYEVWASMRAILMQASYLWYDHVEPILQRAGVPEEEREKAFYEIARHYYRLYGRDEIFSSTKIEPDLETFNKVTLFKRLVDEGKLNEKDMETISKVLMGMKGSCVQASLLWYNSMDRLLQEKGMPEEERVRLFYEMSKPFCRLFRKEEIFPEEIIDDMR